MARLPRRPCLHRAAEVQPHRQRRAPLVQIALLVARRAPQEKKVKNAVAFISSFEEAVAAAECGANGVVCGHIHSAEIRQIGDVTNYNDGDWFESCTALVEHADGTMAIIDWAAKVRDEKVAQRRERAAVPA